MDEYRLARVLTAEVSGGQKAALNSREMRVEAERQYARDRNEWGTLVYMWMIEFHATIFAWFLYSFGPPSVGLYT